MSIITGEAPEQTSDIAGQAPGWAGLSLWRWALYLVMAVIVAAVPAAIAGAVVGVIADAAGIAGARALTGAIGLAALVLFTVLVFRWMRDDINYVDSKEWATRNPHWAATWRHWP